MRSAKLALPLLAALLAACSDDPSECSGVACGAASPPIELRVIDTSGAPIVGAQVTAAHQDGLTRTEVSCGDQPSIGTFCQIDIVPGPAATPVGTYFIHVEAEGFVPSDTEVTVPAIPPGGCCNPGYVSQSIDIKLTRL